MAGAHAPRAGYRLESRTEAHGRLRLELRPDDPWLDALVPCQLTIDHVELALGGDGEETIVVDGIGNVETHPDHRRRGLATELLGIADGIMRGRGAQAALLYGIDGFYRRLGWTSCGGERWVEIDRSAGIHAPEGWSVRRMHRDDMAALESCYREVARGVRGAALRPTGGRVWSRLDPGDVLICRDSTEQIAGWAWRGEGRLGERDEVAGRRPDCDVWGELQATSVDAMRTLLAGVLGARDDSGRRAQAPLLTGAPEGHPLRALCRTGEVACRIVDEQAPDGGMMFKPIAPGIEALQNLYQFLPDRF